MPTFVRLAAGVLLAAFAGIGIVAVVRGQVTTAGISTDRTQYHPGDAINICYAVPGAGPITITDYSSDGGSSVLASYVDDGTGGCFVATAQGPASSERLVLIWSTESDGGSVETDYTVVAASGTRVLTLADANTDVTVAAGDTIDAELGSDLNWHLTASDTAVLQPASGPLPSGVQGRWLAVNPGQSTISGQGDPRCYPQCLSPSRIFSAAVTVVQGPSGGSLTGQATVRGQVLLALSGGAPPPAGVALPDHLVAVPAGVPVEAVAAGNGPGTAITTATTDDGGRFVLSLPAGAYWIFVPRSVAHDFPQLGIPAFQVMPDGTPVVVWQSVKLAAGDNLPLSLRVPVPVP